MMDVDIEKLKAEITCFLCHNILSDPKSLPCQHVYCSQCLLKVNVSERLTCPECNEVHVNCADIASLPTPHVKKRCIATYKDMCIPVTSQPIMKKCEIHSMELLSLYCDTCGLVCRECVRLYCDKESHGYKNAEEMVKIFQNDISQDHESLSMLHKQTSAVLSKLLASSMSLGLAHEEKLRTVNSTFDSLANILQQERDHSIESIHKTFEEQKKQNFYLTNKIDETVESLQCILQSIPSCLSNPLIEDLVALMKRIGNVRETVRSISHEQIDLPDIEVDLCSPSGLKTFLDERVRVYKGECPLRSYVEDFDFESVPVNESSEVTVHVHLNDLEGHLGNVTLHSELLCSYDNSPETVNFNRVSSNTYSLFVTPRKRGNHTLSIQCNGKHICGSPIPLYVTIAPDKLASINPIVRDLRGIVAIKYYEGNLYVTEDDAALKVMNLSATKVERRFEIRAILEIAIGAGFYYATVRRNTVIKMDTKGNILKSIGKRGNLPGEFDIVNGIALKDGEVYVCDTGNNRIQVFDENLNFIRSMGVFGHERSQLSKPDNVAFDEDGNIYVVEEDNHRVQVLTPMCRHLRYIGTNGSRPGQLNKPVSVAIFRGLIYVVEIGNKRVSIFTKTGEFVAKFADALISEPDNIVVDENGYIYVTDSRSKLFIF